jgi:hypothetical protein
LAIADSDDVDLPAGKDFHYFLSHKKSHSVHGGIPAQIAKNLHDSLELLGFEGWFDVDNLAKIAQEEVRDAIAKSATLVVVLNDETHLSEWCAFEWRVAAEMDVPVKVVLDMERSSKQSELALIGVSHPNLMTYQWTELTDRHRRECLLEVSTFLEEITSSSRIAIDDQEDGVLRVGATGAQLLHDSFEGLLIFGGIPYRTPTTRACRLYVTCILYGRAICLSVCTARMVYMTGPSFTDIHSALAVVLLHVCAFYVPMRLNRSASQRAPPPRHHGAHRPSGQSPSHGEPCGARCVSQGPRVECDANDPRFARGRHHHRTQPAPLHAHQVCRPCHPRPLHRHLRRRLRHLSPSLLPPVLHWHRRAAMGPRLRLGFGFHLHLPHPADHGVLLRLLCAHVPLAVGWHDAT